MNCKKNVIDYLIRTIKLLASTDNQQFLYWRESFDQFYEEAFEQLLEAYNLERYWRNNDVLFSGIKDFVRFGPAYETVLNDNDVELLKQIEMNGEDVENFYDVWAKVLMQTYSNW